MLFPKGSSPIGNGCKDDHQKHICASDGGDPSQFPASDSSKLSETGSPPLFASYLSKAVDACGREDLSRGGIHVIHDS